MKSVLIFFLFLATTAFSQAFNNTLRGKVLYQSSGNKPAVGVRIAEPDANPTFSVDNGDFLLKFQNKRSGAGLALEVGRDNGKSEKIELVNEKEIKSAKLPSNEEEVLDIIVCPAGQRDIAAQKYYRILRTTADRELEKKQKAVELLLAQKDKDFKKISDLYSQLDQIQTALDSAKIREQAFLIASINLDRASQLVKDALQKIEDENDVETALKILSAQALDTAYAQASVQKKKANFAIQQVIEGYEFRIKLLEPQFKFGEIVECCEKIINIYENEGLEKSKLAECLDGAAGYAGDNGDYEKQLLYEQKALSVLESISSEENFVLLQRFYNNISLAYGALGDYENRLTYSLKSLDILEKISNGNHTDLATNYNNISISYYKLGNYSKGIEFAQKSIDEHEKAKLIDSLELAKSYQSLAHSLVGIGNDTSALKYGLMAMAIVELNLPANHPDVAACYDNLSVTYYTLGEVEKALEYTLKSIAISEQIYSKNHPNLAYSYLNLATYYGALGDYQKQLDANLKGLSIWEKTVPPEHPEIAKACGNLAFTYFDLGNYSKSLEYDLRALSIREKSLPQGHPDFATSYNNIGLTYSKLHQFPKAKEYFEKFQKINNSSRVFRNWAVYYGLQGKKKEALKNLKKAVALGYNNLHWIETDDSLESIRKEKGYKEVIEQLKKQ